MSDDYGKGKDQAALKGTSPEDWLLDYMRAEIDAVAVTDHNTGDWVDILKTALGSSVLQSHADFRPLTLFPGVELTANGGTHVLAIFDPAASTAHVDALLGACGFDIQYKGTSQKACTCSLQHVVEKIIGAGAVPILAHVDVATGAFVDLKGNTLTPLLQDPLVYTYEMRDPRWPIPVQVVSEVRGMTQVIGSDSHHRTGAAGQQFPGSHFTWVKMEEPDLEGLRLALLDGNGMSVVRFDQMTGDPNTLPDLWIECVIVSKATRMGNGQPLKTCFSPKLNTIIGGRGTGKSTILEFLRMAFGRADEIPRSLRSDFDSYFGVEQLVAGKGAYRADTIVKVVLWKDETRMALHFQAGNAEPTSYVFDSGQWKQSVGSVHSRFPIRIYSQKQIYNMASDRLGPLRGIDQHGDVDYDSWKANFDEAVAGYLDLRGRARQLRQRLATNHKLEGELEDTKRKLEVFERMGHEAILKEHARRESQHAALKEMLEYLQGVQNSSDGFLDNVQVQDIDPSAFDRTLPGEAGAVDILQEARTIANQFRKEVQESLGRFKTDVNQWFERVKASEVMKLRKEAKDKYDTLSAELAKQGVANMQQYGLLVQKRAQLEKELKELAALPAMIQTIEGNALAACSELGTLRAEITDRRQTFINVHIGASPSIRIRISPFSLDPGAVERQWRDLLARPTSMAEPFIGADGKSGMIGELFDGLSEDHAKSRDDLQKRIADLKREVDEIVMGGNPKSRLAWLLTYVRSLPPETLDRVRCWWPEDNLEIDYLVPGTQNEYRPIQYGSPGQKTAGILAFLLAFGTEPMILDQPEDDLDNQLIYDLIVSQLRENKKRRQVIIVTHNPNIVVNGDSEYVIPLDFKKGQSVIVDPPGAGSLQSREVRNEVCRVMEGGKDAFAKRYKRLALENVHV